ncbi:MAG: endonuclease MutS2, partial [Nitrospirales bacterium]
ALGQETASSMGREHCFSLPLARDLSTALQLQNETKEMLSILEGDQPLPLLVFPDIRGILNRVAKEGILDGPELRDISIVLGFGHTAKSIIQFHAEFCPNLGQHGKAFKDVGWVKRSIDHCIDPHGTIRETASPELFELTQKSQALRHTMRRKLEHMLTSQEYEEQLQERFFAEREGRYVIPIKSERQHAVDGIIHDISSSGATVFIEPRHLIELNNAIKFADLQVAQETRRILQDLSNLVMESVFSIRENLDELAHLDCLMAKARLSQKMQGIPIKLIPHQAISLHHARHPLLMFTKEVVIPNSINIDGTTRMLVISGPNAGGKTVSLKMIGLFALMVKAGLFPPCSSDSEMGLFHRVYADIGDTQDLTKDLSSFSGHIVNMIGLLQDIASTPDPEAGATLVLLDEVGNSTDPVEGAALAEALLCHLSEQGCTVLVTTHYPSLKTLAVRNPLAHNASQEFNLDTLSPTYRLLDGIPGRSSALEIAGRLGLDPQIICHAESLIERKDHHLQQVFQSLQDSQRRLDEDLTKAHQLREEAQRIHQEAEAMRATVQQQEREDRRRYRKQWQREFSQAQRTLHDLFNDIKNKKSSESARQSQQTLTALNQEILEKLSQSEEKSSVTPQEGDWVEIDGLGTQGVLLEALEGKKQVLLQVGSRTLKTSPRGLRVIAAPASSSGRSVKSSKVQRRTAIAFTPSHPARYEETIDLRGSRVEEGLELVELTLDRAMASQTRYVKIIHGRGTGALQSSIRHYCRSSPYIKLFRPGEPAEGGEGVTIIELN